MKAKELEELIRAKVRELNPTYPGIHIIVQIPLNDLDNVELYPFKVTVPDRVDITFTPDFDDGVSWTVEGTFKGGEFECSFSTDWTPNIKSLWETALWGINDYLKDPSN